MNSKGEKSEQRDNGDPLLGLRPCGPQYTPVNHTCAFHSPTPVASVRYPSAMCGPGSLSSMESSECLHGFVDMWCDFPIRSTVIETLLRMRTTSFSVHREVEPAPASAVIGGQEMAVWPSVSDLRQGYESEEGWLLFIKLVKEMRDLLAAGFDL
ncbi:hypothetical protein DPX16_16828 [Anabarilius grahami]|uniref:Uncharacterized protein n=1 Tax=Anabarilius grahami TaxID=495550 RepID=A0A3N0YSN7_ANAGA|nr:hypothetical protein DPX16_16828 [Anabarilius grahami]